MTATMAKTPAVPSSSLPKEFKNLQLNETLQANAQLLYKVPLTNLNCSFDVVTPATHPESLQDIVRQNSKMNHTDVTLLYAIRQPGCGSCREHGLQLSEYVASDRRLSLMGTVKDIGANDEAILQFYQNYFRGHSLYVDPKWNIYKAIGAKKLSLKRALFGFFGSQRRWRNKGIQCMFNASDSFVQGGLLVFDREGTLRFVVEAKDFIEMDMSALESAVVETRRLYRLEKKKASKAPSVASSTSLDTSESSSS